MQLTIHSCGHTKYLFCARAEVYTAAARYSGVTHANTPLRSTNFLQNLLHSYGLYYIHSEPDDKLLQINLFLKICGAFKKVYIEQAASCFSLLIMIPFKIQSLEVLQGTLLGFHSLY